MAQPWLGPDFTQFIKNFLRKFFTVCLTRPMPSPEEAGQANKINVSLSLNLTKMAPKRYAETRKKKSPHAHPQITSAQATTLLLYQRHSTSTENRVHSVRTVRTSWFCKKIILLFVVPIRSASATQNFSLWLGHLVHRSPSTRASTVAALTLAAHQTR